MVMQLPERDELSQTREQLHAQLAIAMGGRVAEEIIFGDDKVTTGAASDIEQATKRARAMALALFVACSISLAAPVVTLSSPNIISSATLPPIAIANCA